jgi:hypothetical protein
MKIKILIGLVLVMAVSAMAEPINTNYLNKVVKAIYQVEGGAKTKYPYGIKSINTHGDVAKAKRICENTVRNNYARWIKAGREGSFLDFLADRYCPPSADPQGNVNWKKNIHKLVDKGK